MKSAIGGDAANPIGGALLVLGIVLMFAVGDSITKQLVARYPVEVVVAIRFAASSVMLAAIFGPRLGRRLWYSKRPWALLARSFCMAMGALFMGLSLQRMPLGETVAITYAAPLLVMLAAVPILGEQAGRGSILIAILGFGGVLVIARPGGGLDPWGIVFCIGNVLFFVAYQLLTRMLSQTESALVMITNLSLVSALVFGAMAFPHLAKISPPPGDIALMVVLGGIATFGHFLYSIAYRLAPASTVAPMGYFHLVWAVLLSWLIFGHLPDAVTLLGMAMILTAGVSIVLMAYLEGRSDREETF
jgi:drug/metabolite transporter (DMT)-like permease